MAQTINYQKVKSDTGSGSLVSTGTILPWSKSTAPTGFLKCDGSAVSRNLYSNLFQVIGTTYGSGDGSTTFNLPDLTSRSVVGANTSTSVGQTGGAHDTDGAGFTLQNNLSAQNSQNLATQVTNNLSIQNTQNLGIQTTQNLGIQTAQNLSNSTSQNLSAQTTQNLSGSVSGNISNHTITLAQVASHNHPGRLLGNQGTMGNTTDGGRGFPSVGNAGSNQAHTHGNNFTGNITGTHSTNLSGNVNQTLSGDVSANITGNATSEFTGNAVGNLSGADQISVNLTGNVGANLSGDVTIQNASLYQPHLIVIYIIKT